MNEGMKTQDSRTYVRRKAAMKDKESACKTKKTILPSKKYRRDKIRCFFLTCVSTKQNICIKTD